ncbi:MAG TPA: flagellar hook capping FlgD N-terminal domain-containing protein [Chthonomonadaceae bacterium]|nr:flagellar hook capping FlgD N-terminal domain-containing protein [Chthonomonadaceae bacterium]
MAIAPVSSSDPSTALSTAVQQTAGGQLGEQQFLQLLVTQLTNQDPLQPQDQSQFLAQLAQFSTVEGVNNMASAQSKLQASSLLGKTVAAQVVTNNVPATVSGQVTAVRYGADGVHVDLADGSDITLDQIKQVSN